jgi:hypothetical protein
MNPIAIDLGAGRRKVDGAFGFDLFGRGEEDEEMFRVCRTGADARISVPFYMSKGARFESRCSFASLLKIHGSMLSHPRPESRPIF